MTEVNATGNDRRRAGVRRTKKPGPVTDMTPMVDLGFLLITFFVMTTELSRPAEVNLNMHKEGSPTTLGNSNALTVLLDSDNRVYYYHGNKDDAFAKGEVFRTNFSVADGLGKVIRDKQQWLDVNNQKEGREGLMLLIKAGTGARYENVINAMDEALINVVKKYTILPAEADEAAWMKQQEP